MELKRQMGFGSYQTAWSWLHKIRKAMVAPDRLPLAVRGEADETDGGGPRPGRPGRGAAGKTKVAGAVESGRGHARGRRLGRPGPVDGRGPGQRRPRRHRRRRPHPDQHPALVVEAVVAWTRPTDAARDADLPVGAGLRIEHIPALGLSAGAPGLRRGIIGVHLHGQALARENIFDQEVEILVATVFEPDLANRLAG